LGINYFELFELEQKYEIDLTVLHRQYLQKQTLHHPDRSGSGDERIKNLEISMQLNEGYKILKDDFLRAEHLLKILGQKFDDQELKGKLSSAELEEIMESYEQLEDLETIDQLKSFKMVKLKEKEKITLQLMEAFRNNHTGKAVEIALSLKYLTNLVGNIDAKIKNANNRD
jgi:molecular chaperone HscB